MRKFDSGILSNKINSNAQMNTQSQNQSKTLLNFVFEDFENICYEQKDENTRVYYIYNNINDLSTITTKFVVVKRDDIYGIVLVQTFENGKAINKRYNYAIPMIINENMVSQRVKVLTGISYIPFTSSFRRANDERQVEEDILKHGKQQTLNSILEIEQGERMIKLAFLAIERGAQTSTQQAEKIMIDMCSIDKQYSLALRVIIFCLVEGNATNYDQCIAQLRQRSYDTQNLIDLITDYRDAQQYSDDDNGCPVCGDDRE